MEKPKLYDLVKCKSVNEDKVELKDLTYYLVKVSLNPNNLVFEAILFSGFVDDNNIPKGYNSIISNGDKIAEFNQLHYLEIVKELVSVK